jgi:biopolymer transport protein ExbB/TolQ
MQDVLRQLSSGLLIPVMVILVALALYGLWSIGSVVAEVFIERRHFKETIPVFIRKIENANPSEVPDIIENSGMLASHRDALLIVADNMYMSSANLYALAKREIGLLSEKYSRITARTDMAAKIAPMFGLMGTLIPLGPGIVAMGQGYTEELAASLLVAFDTTVAGLVTAAVCMAISKIRKTWYQKYLGAVEAAMTAVLEKAQIMREEGIEPPRVFLKMNAKTPEHERLMQSLEEEANKGRVGVAA